MAANSRPKKVFALIDCNNFFVSCERVFRPDLWDKPVAVLSNNDGCLIARSDEVRAMGIPMAAPKFKSERELQNGRVTLFSANFPLYGDFSQRVSEIIRGSAPNIEVYSVDESFVELSDMAITDYASWANKLRRQISKQTGLPVSIGVASTKTLAKAGADYAKKHLDSGGVQVAVGKPTEEFLRQLPVEGVWGIGWRTAPKLQQLGISMAYDLTMVSDKWALTNLTIRGLKTVKELRGEPCLALESGNEPQKSIARTRSFAHTVRNYHELESAIATFAAIAAGKLRQNREVTSSIVSFIRTGKHADIRHSVSAVCTLEQPSSDTAVIMSAALKNLASIYDPDFGYKRVGVVLVNLSSDSAHQLALLQSNPKDLDKQERLMKAVDGINKKYGTRLVKQATETLGKQRWHSKREQRSPDYTISWQDLAWVKS